MDYGLARLPGRAAPGNSQHAELHKTVDSRVNRIKTIDCLTILKEFLLDNNIFAEAKCRQELGCLGRLIEPTSVLHGLCPAIAQAGSETNFPALRVRSLVRLEWAGGRTMRSVTLPQRFIAVFLFVLVTA